MPEPSRGEAWLVDFNPTRGREQAGVRPALIVSADAFNRGPAGLVVVLPMTSVAKGIASHVLVGPPEGGLRVTSFVKCEDIRSISKDRLIDRWGHASPVTIAEVQDRLRVLLSL